MSVYVSHGTEMACQTCGKTWVRSHFDQGTKYCSQKCYHKAREIDWRDGDSIKWSLDRYGYLRGYAKDHPVKFGRNNVYQHWHVFYEANNYADWVIEAKKNGATIHHKNGIRSDNRIENLELWVSGNHPRGWSLDDIIEWLEELGYEIIPPEL